MKTAVVILNYNGELWLKKFLPNVIQHSKEADIYIIDNGSTDKSIELLNRKDFQIYKNEGNDPHN